MSHQRSEANVSLERSECETLSGYVSGDLRFRAPVPPTVWRGIRNATEIGPQCAQQPRAPEFSSFPVFLDSEDCLHLNVYTPRVINK